MRVLFLNPVGEVGGAERMLLAAVAGIRAAAIVRVIALADGPLIAAVRTLGVEAEVVPLPDPMQRLGDSQTRGKFASAVRVLPALPALGRHLANLRTAVNRFGPDLVHSNGIKTHLLSRLTVPRRMPVVWHVHDFFGQRRLAGWLLARARQRCRLAVAVSEAVAADARRTLPGVPIAIVPNAIDLAHFTPGPGDGPDLDRRAGLPPAPPGTVRVGLVATYARWKGHLAFLDVAARLTDRPVRWYIVGGPIYRTSAQFTEDELRAATSERGLSDRVGFVPFAPDPAPVYRALDVVVHASTLPEPFGLTVAEAMVCGRAVVVSQACGAAELFEPNRDALVIAPGDAPELAAAIDRLVTDAKLRAKLGVAAHRVAEARFDQTRYGPQLLAVYRRVLEGVR